MSYAEKRRQDRDGKILRFRIKSSKNSYIHMTILLPADDNPIIL